MEQMSTEQQETSAVCTGTAHGRLSVERLRELLHYDPETGVFRWKIDRHCALNGVESYGQHCENSEAAKCW